MVNAGLVGIMLLFTIIGAAFGASYITGATMNGQISSYQSVISSLSEHPSGDATITQFVVSVVTQTNAGSTTTVTSDTTVTSVVTSTETELSNVTVLFHNSGTLFNYTINWATFTNEGSSNMTSLSLPVSPVYTGEQIFIGASCTACSLNATLYIGTHAAINGSGTFSTPLSINYTF
jgi:hypothetical protein